MATDIRHEANEAARKAWSAAVENHIRHRRWDPVLVAAVNSAERWIDAIDAADSITESQLDAWHEATHADIDDLAAAEDIPLAYSPYRYPAAFADWTELELRSAHGDR